MAINAPALPPPSRFNLHHRLGRGAQCSVYSADDTLSGHAVAIKLLHAALSEDEGYKARLQREWRAASSLSHPGIVAVHAPVEIERRPGLVMALIDGAPLTHRLLHGPAFSIHEVTAIGLQLAYALAHAHARGVVHADIKPGNLLLARQGLNVTLIDFGIARFTDEPDHYAGQVLGTPQYMSPEQSQGLSLDGRSDLFSTGLVLYELLTGQRAFHGHGARSLAQAITSQQHTPAQALRTDTPPALSELIDRCLAKHPAQRWGSADALAHALARLAAAHG